MQGKNVFFDRFSGFAFPGEEYDGEEDGYVT